MQLADNLGYYFDPAMAPTDMIPWLANWVCLTLDDNWSEEQRRRLIHSASELYSRRGTKRGLIEYLFLYTGVEPEIAEYVDGMNLGPETFLGVNTTIAGRERHSFTVTLNLNGLTETEVEFKELFIRRIIEAEKPAHTAYRLNILVDGKTRKKAFEKEPLTDPSSSDSNPVVNGSDGGNGASQNNPLKKKPRVNSSKIESDPAATDKDSGEK